MFTFIRKTYNAAYFGTLVPTFLQQTKEKARLVTSVAKHGDLLEVGCGEGSLLKELQDTFRITGVDISPFALQKAQKVVAKDKLRLLDIEKEDLQGSYDVVLAFDVLEHLRHPGKAIWKIRETLKDNGFFIFCVPNNHGIFGKIATAVLNFFDRTHISTLKRDEWMRLLGDVRLKIVKVMNKSVFGIHGADVGKYVASSFIVIAQKIS